MRTETAALLGQVSAVCLVCLLLKLYYSSLTCWITWNLGTLRTEIQSFLHLLRFLSAFVISPCARILVIIYIYMYFFFYSHDFMAFYQFIHHRKNWLELLL